MIDIFVNVFMLWMMYITQEGCTDLILVSGAGPILSKKVK